jgi:hypothetical protein
VTERPKLLGPPTVVLIQRISDNPVDTPDHSTSSVSVSFTSPRAFHPSTSSISISFTSPKSVSLIMQILQHIGGTNKRKQLQ